MHMYSWFVFISSDTVDYLSKKLLLSTLFYLLEINFVHLESRLKDPWSQYSAPQQILVNRSDTM